MWEAGIKEATLLQDHPPDSPPPTISVGHLVQDFGLCLARGRGTVPTAAWLRPLPGAWWSQRWSQQGQPARGPRWDNATRLRRNRGRGGGGRNRKIDCRHPMCLTSFIYEHMRDTFRNFQKYLSVVGVILQKCWARGNKILVPPPPTGIRRGKT